MLWSTGTVGIPFLFCVAPLASQDWRVWSAVLATGALLLGWGWVEVWPVHPEDLRFGAAAVAFLALCTAAFAAGAAGRALGLVLQRRGRSRRQVLWTDALGLAVPAGLMLALRLA